jgi:hypothetical protein
MLAFLDFEASSLSNRSYPIEVAWVFEDGLSESHLIRPAADWDDWDDVAQAIHGIPRATLLTEGEAHDAVAARMIQSLDGHDLCASAPSWDGKWLSVLLRASRLPRHSLRLRATDDILADTALRLIEGSLPETELPWRVVQLVKESSARSADWKPAHRALADAQSERDRWLYVRREARKLADRTRDESA